MLFQENSVFISHIIATGIIFMRRWNIVARKSILNVLKEIEEKPSQFEEK